MNITVVSDFSEFYKLREDWNRLLGLTCYDTVFLTHEWFASFIQGFALENKLAIILVYDGAELVGIMPLYRDVEKHGCLNICFLKSITNVHTPKYSFIMKKGWENCLAETLRISQKVLRWDVIQTDYVSDRTSMFKSSYLINQEPGFRVKIVHVMQSPFIQIDGDWDIYYAGKFSKSLRVNLEKSIRRAQKSYKVAYENINGDRLREDDLEGAFAIEDSGWKGENGSSIMKNDSFKFFYTMFNV